ncbi:MAG: gamma-glutamylcyclotransferase [Rhodospirillaceae bacterium]|nr:gamma-glutamylcyclotransferase [Rhodospirillaceae bacterium]
MWIFGYGSLMWHPGFRFVERHRAVLSGQQRAFCVRTVHHRGTPGLPGLVMGLKPDGVCVGIAYLVESALAEQVADYLRERELDHYPVYREAHVDILLDDAGAVSATTYLPRKDHPDFLPDLTLHEQLAIIRRARGISGTNPDYVRSAAGSLRDMDIDEPTIFAVEKALDEKPAP